MKNIKVFFKEYISIIIGSLMVALSLNCFLVPLKLSAGGVSSVGTVLYYLFGVPVSVSIIAINSLLFFLAYKTLEKQTLIKTVAGIIVLTAFLELTDGIRQLTDDIFIASASGGVLIGCGVGITLLSGASTGGSDFASVMIKKLFPHISVGTILMSVDFIIVSLSGFVFRNYTLTIYSLISLYLSSKLADFILVRGDRAKCAYIISNKSDVISQKIMHTMGRGVTGISSKGIYTGSEFTMLMCVVKSKEIPPLINTVKAEDPQSFVIISDVREVHGVGFK